MGSSPPRGFAVQSSLRSKGPAWWECSKSGGLTNGCGPSSTCSLAHSLTGECWPSIRKALGAPSLVPPQNKRRKEGCYYSEGLREGNASLMLSCHGIKPALPLVKLLPPVGKRWELTHLGKPNTDRTYWARKRS